MRLKDKIALITGGAAGIARPAELFVREGATVVIADRDAARASAAAQEIGPSATAVTVDVSVGADVKRMMDATVARLGRLDILVNNAAMASAATSSRPMRRRGTH